MIPNKECVTFFSFALPVLICCMSRPLPPILPAWVPLGIVLVLATVYAYLFYDFQLPPYEDAAMIMRYASNWASGGGIAFNPGEEPVDGATDFGFMAMVMLLIRWGASPELAVRVLTIGAHVLTVVVLYRATLRYQVAPRWAAVGSAAFLAMGPALAQIESYFGTVFFALFALLAFVQVIKIAKGDKGWSPLIWFSIYGLCTGLVRPEGVFLAGFMLLALVWFQGLRQSWRAIAVFAGIFGLLGGAYFIWHWKYFGYPLPNPFYIKGGGTLYFSSLRISAFNVLKLAGPVIPILFLGLRNREQRRMLFFMLIPIVGFTVIWVLMSNAMNYMMRFQYVTLPMILLAWPWVLKNFNDDFRTEDWTVLKESGITSLRLSLAAFLVIILLYQHYQYADRPRYFRDGRYDLALRLEPFKTKDYTLVASEAGLLPFYTGWRSIDPWGLNDKHIAHTGTVTQAYLAQNDPAIIMYRAQYSPITPKRSLWGDWSAMLDTLETYAQRNNYILAAAWGDSPWFAHYYYVKPGLPDTDTLVALIRQSPYHWHETELEAGNEAVNYGK